MRARGFALGFMAAAALLAGARAVGAQPKVPRVGVITPAFDTHPALIAFRERLRELGYVEGKTLVIDYRSAKGDGARLPALAAELVNLPVNVILADFRTSGRLSARLLLRHQLRDSEGPRPQDPGQRAPAHAQRRVVSSAW
jgi:putative ABC transport system substrate-binding protein